MNNQMENHFVKKTWRHINPKLHRPFNICIMDEASQCVEPEALIPLKLGFMKLVMVGDPGTVYLFLVCHFNLKICQNCKVETTLIPQKITYTAQMGLYETACGW